MTTQTAHSEQVGRLVELIADIRVAMLTTATPDGSLRSRPMLTRSAGEDGLWFFTHAGDAKVDEALKNPHVNVSFAEPAGNRYVSVSGSATLVHDREKMRELWDESERAWFPGGLDDPDLALLWVSVERAEYWDAPTGAMAPVPGESVKLDQHPTDEE